MSPVPQVLQFLVVAVAGWINQQPRDVMDSLQEEHRVRVVVPIEADIGRLAGAHRTHHVRLKRVRRQGKQPGLFLRQHVGDRPVRLIGMAPLMRDLVPPPAKLGVEIVEVAKRPGRKERVAEVLDLALDFSLLIAAGRRTGPGRKVIVPRELEQAGVKLNRRASPIEHGTAEVVVHQGPGTPAEGLEGGNVPPQEALERLVQREEREEGALAESSSVLAVSGSPTPRAGAGPPRPRASGDGYAVTGTPWSRPIPSSAGIDS